MVIKVVIFYKISQPSSSPGSHYKAGGLSTNALHTVGVLNSLGIEAHLVPVLNFTEIKKWMADHHPVSHCVIEAVWVEPQEVRELAAKYPKTTFAIRAHSKMGFLQVEPEAITKMRRIIRDHWAHPNLWFSTNNEEFAKSLHEVYGQVLYLPNLYDIKSSPPRKYHNGKVLKIASFGATRLLKLHPNAALAALQISSRLNRPLEFYINTDKTPGGDSVRRTIKNMFADYPGAKLIELPWQNSDEFKETIASMDLVLQLSATETFCMVAADAVASGVPVIVGPAITWIPHTEKVDIDDTSDAAARGILAIKFNEWITYNQYVALSEYVHNAKNVWLEWLGLKHLPDKKWWKIW